MANPEHVEIAKLGAAAIGSWREGHPDEKLDLRLAELSGADLSNADLSDADLHLARLAGAILRDANLSNADLSWSRLSGASLYRACLRSADLEHADLCGAFLSRVNLWSANLTEADLKGVNLQDAVMGSTILERVDLSSADGLESVEHLSPSKIDVDALLRFRGSIPEHFISGCGVPEALIKHLPNVLKAIEPLQFYACFIVHCPADRDFARRFHDRLQHEGVRAWINEVHDADDDRIQWSQWWLSWHRNDVLRGEEALAFLVLSDASMRSHWILTELMRIAQVERRRRRARLVPISLTGADKLRDWKCPCERTGQDFAETCRDHGIHDFSKWKDQKAFATAFATLLRDLKTRAAN